MHNLRIGMIGAGSMGQCAHLRNYLCTPGCEVVALAELRPTLAKAVAQRYGIANVYEDHRSMLAGEKLDAIVSIQPFQSHGALIPQVLAAGLPVMIEKPLARSIAAGEKIISAIGAGRLFVGYHKRSDPATVVAKKQIEAWKASGEVGAMKYIRLTMPPGDWMAGGFSHVIHSNEPYPKLESDPPPAGMDETRAKKHEAFVNYYIHQVNLMRHLLGENYRVTFANDLLMVVQSDSGVTGALEMQPYRTSIDWQEQALVTFETGWVRLELPAPLAIDQPGRVTIFEGKGVENRGEGHSPRTIMPTLPLVHAMKQQAVHFVAAVRGEKTPLCEAHEALEDLRIARQFIDLSREFSN